MFRSSEGTFRRTWTILTAMLAVMLIAAGDLSADPPNRAKLNGSYDMTLVGDYTGTGKAVVTPRFVHLNLAMRSAEGADVSLSFSSMPLDEGGFESEKTINGVLFKVMGRVEAADGTIVLVPRVSCLISASDGKVARAIGQRKSD